MGARNVWRRRQRHVPEVPQQGTCITLLALGPCISHASQARTRHFVSPHPSSTLLLISWPRPSPLVLNPLLLHSPWLPRLIYIAGSRAFVFNPNPVQRSTQLQRYLGVRPTLGRDIQYGHGTRLLSASGRLNALSSISNMTPCRGWCLHITARPTYPNVPSLHVHGRNPFFQLWTITRIRLNIILY